jgi:serine/threonine-protein phosphatase CPPED1
MCDPQLGFTDYASDLGRFEQAIRQINTLHPDLVVICGDLVNAAKPQSFTDFNEAEARLTMPAYAAAGNHDVGNHPSHASLEQYRHLVGKDYYAVDHKGCLFVVVNSQLWKAPIAGETDKQDAWLAQTLEAAAKKQRRIFLVMHYPLFVKQPDEPEGYYNLPLPARRELLALLERYRVEAVLAGHTHTTSSNDYHGIQMVTSENTSRNFDKHPSGFRVWHVASHPPSPNEFVPLSKQ